MAQKSASSPPELDPKPAGAELEPFLNVDALAEALNQGLRVATYTKPAVRNRLAERYRNGLHEFCRKDGTKLLISLPGFRWHQRQKHDAPPEQLELGLRGGA